METLTDLSCLWKKRNFTWETMMNSWKKTTLTIFRYRKQIQYEKTVHGNNSMGGSLEIEENRLKAQVKGYILQANELKEVSFQR